MSIQAFTEDKGLAALLLLEAKRQGFRPEGEPSIIFVDLDTARPPRGTVNAPIVALSADPARLSAHAESGFFALCALPFSVKDFEEILHRSGGKSPKVRFRLVGNTLLLNGQRIPLSATEARLLDLLYQNRDRVVTEQEMEAVLGESAARTNTVAVYLYRLRRKLGTEGISHIRRVRGKGCQWIDT